MSGYSLVLKLRRFEDQIKGLGVRMAYPRHRNNADVDQIALLPADDNSLPVYTLDKELFVGTIEQAEEWIQGVKWAREYDRMLGLSDNKARENREQKIRNQNLVKTIKESSEDKK